MKCFGAVLYVRRSWVTKVRKGLHGHWTYWAAVRTNEKTRHHMISRSFFDDLIRSKVPRRQDHCHFPDQIVKPPTKTVRVK